MKANGKIKLSEAGSCWQRCGEDARGRYRGEKKEVMIDAWFSKQELLNCIVSPQTAEKRRGGIVVVAHSAAQVQGELRGRRETNAGSVNFIPSVRRGKAGPSLRKRGNRGMGGGEK